MSRTYKDKKEKYKNPYYVSFEDAYIRIGNRRYGSLRWIQVPGVKKKRKRHYDDAWTKYSSAPGWFTNLFMNRPLRREFRIYLLKLDPKLLEDCDPPCHLYKKFVYYW